MENNKISFRDYLKQNRVMIPIIQRDYAQGRSDKGSLRKNFLASLKDAMDGTLPNNQEKLKLDFVYGSLENGVMLPLDGQQRLTTLWLLHWYVALKAGRLAEAQSVLACFTYETRRSSHEFCKCLCNPDNFKDLADTEKVSQYITNCTWFVSTWHHDPTITSMLRMISGTVIDLEKVDKKLRKESEEANARIDGLEKLFQNTLSEEFSTYWDKLVSETPPFFFYQLKLNEFDLSDDLYVKMNARGKQLTPFENFKADLIGYIRQRAKDKKEGVNPDRPDSDKDWEALLDPRTGIPIKLDTDWTEIFWNHRSKNNTIDEIFFSFLNRVFWEELVSTRNSKADNAAEDPDSENGAKILEANTSYRFLIADDIGDYHDLSPYKFYKGEIPYALFEHLNTILDRIKNISALPEMLRNVGEKFHFIPIYDDDSKKNEPISRLTQPHRVIFHAVYKYLLEGDFDATSYSRWMRVVCNLTSGKSLGNDWYRYVIRTTATMLAAIDAVSSIDSHNVYESLRIMTLPNSSKEIPTRLKEEIIKALRIIDQHGLLQKSPSSSFANWEDAIREAENYAFFNGSIRFLYQDADGNVDWNYFELKLAKAKEYFSPEIPNDDGKNVVAGKYADSALLLRALISRFNAWQFWDVIWWRKHFIFDNSEMSWRHYLYNDHLHKPLHEFLTQDANIVPRQDSLDRAERMLYLLSNTELLDYAIKKFHNSYIRTYHGHDAIYPSATGVFLDAADRDDFLYDEEIEIINGEKVPNTALIYGTNIDFRFKDNIYRWRNDNNIYLMDASNPDQYTTSEQSGNIRYYSFDPKKQPKEIIKEGLRRLPILYAEETKPLESIKS